MVSLKMMKGKCFGFVNLLDQNQVAEMLCVSPKTLEYWRWKKKGPKSFKVGRLVRYRESDILAYVMELVGEEVPELNNI
jgi:predicted DNA-binding transcriptional regulator AlpA